MPAILLCLESSSLNDEITATWISTNQDALRTYKANMCMLEQQQDDYDKAKANFMQKKIDCLTVFKTRLGRQALTIVDERIASKQLLCNFISIFNRPTEDLSLITSLIEDLHNVEWHTE